MQSRTQLLLNSLTADNVRDFCYEYSRDNCVNHRLIKYRSAVTGELRDLYVSCGKCRVCRSYRIKEWISRMAIHTQYCRKYVYFITLTYKPFVIYKNIPKCLLDAYWREDSLNSTHRKCYSPCLLRHEHFQRFMHYLRKSIMPATCDFFMCGEYGEHFGRPHFHALIWSDVPITSSQFRNAWRVNISKSTKYPKMVSIGDCRVDDLQANGTLSSNNAKSAFSYVAKYCVKSNYKLDDTCGRLQLFIKDCSTAVVSDEQLNAVFSPRVRSLKSMILSYASYIAPLIHSEEIKDFKMLCNRLSNSSNFLHLLECYNPYNRKNVCPDTQYLFAELSSYFNDDLIYEILKKFYCTSVGTSAFCKVFSPYCLSSNRSPLGKVYALKHLEEYKSDECRLPEVCGFRPIFPRYFTRLAKQSSIRYSFLLPSISKNGYSCRCSANEIDCGNFISNLVSPSIDVSNSYSVYIPFGCARSSITLEEYIKRKRGVIKDYVDNTYIVPTLLPDGLQFDSYRYNRFTRHYDYIDSVTLDEFVKVLLVGVSYARKFDIKSIHDVNYFNSLVNNIYNSLSAFCPDFRLMLSECSFEHDFNYQKLFDLSKQLSTNKPLLQ